ncbi:hypothetical protein DPMN_163417 [Dreissena polymorpha]|uniref:Uncharacterized protein n=1 Tax=Dreissena polymorpha TaxID=45954 RepID=A0A9D4ISS9_DREPO|nr:hypothetical protein DPMN_163417 [Dreissena polymorpha]
MIVKVVNGNNVTSRVFKCPGQSRFANAGRPARTGMILTLFPGAAPVEAGQQTGRVPVNPDWLRFIPVKPWLSPRPGIAPRPGRAPVYRNTAGTHRVYTGIRPRQCYGNAPVSPRSSPFFEELRQTLGIGDPGLTIILRCISSSFKYASNPRYQKTPDT